MGFDRMRSTMHVDQSRTAHLCPASQHPTIRELYRAHGSFILGTGWRSGTKEDGLAGFCSTVPILKLAELHEDPIEIWLLPNFLPRHHIYVWKFFSTSRVTSSEPSDDCTT